MKKPVWLRKDFVLAAQERLLAEHGGREGIRDGGLLESALSRPENLFAYGKPTIFALASAYGCGLIKNHPFVDGNKRVGFIASYVFLARNGFEVTADEADAVLKTLAVAAGELTDRQFAAWLKENSRPIKSRSR